MINRLRMIRQVMYRMKFRYGCKVRLLRRTNVSVDRATGDKTMTIEGLYIRRALVLPNTVHREFFYDLAFIASNKNFTYGGQVGTAERRVVFDKKSLRISAGVYWTLEVGQWFLSEGKRYEVKEISQFEEAEAWLVTGKQSLGEPSDSEIDVAISSAVNLTQDAEGVLA